MSPAPALGNPICPSGVGGVARIVVALALPTVAAAQPDHGKGHQEPTGQTRQSKQPNKVMFVFNGTFALPVAQ